MELANKIDPKSYLMTAGVFAPAFAVYAITSLILDKKMSVNKYALILGGITLIAAGKFTADIIENKIKFRVLETSETSKDE